jgi:hypothetical protein
MEFEEGGFKSSGLGRLGGLGSIEDFLEYKQITQRFSGTAKQGGPTAHVSRTLDRR